VPIERPVIDDFSKARLVWKGEDKALLGIPRKGGNTGPPCWHACMNGAGSPVVGEGVVVYCYFVPAERGGPLYNAPGGSRHVSAPSLLEGEMGKIYMRRDGDDVIACMDAATGLLRWRAVFPSRSLNMQGQGKGRPGTTPCIADGRVFASGNCGYGYGLDLATGAVRWERVLGKGGEALQALKRDVMARKETGLVGFGHAVGNSPIASGPVAIAGVTAFDLRGDGVLVVDPATGATLWEDREANCGWRGFVRAYGGPGGPLIAYPMQKKYGFHLILAEPRTGKRVFDARVEGLGGDPMWCLSDDILLVGQPFGAGGHIGKAREYVRAMGLRLHLKEQRLEKLWSFHAVKRIDSISCGPIFDDKGRLLIGGHRDCGLAAIAPATGAVEWLQPPDGQGSYFQLQSGYGRTFMPSGYVNMQPQVPEVPGKRLPDVLVPGMQFGYEDVMPEVPLADGRMFIRTWDTVLCGDLRVLQDQK
jgi:outer membrane protein assembly factor BamB